MTKAPRLASRTVLPSGLARATNSQAMAPPAPPRSSTMTSSPRFGPSSLASTRASWSTGPPAANGTTILIGSAIAGGADSEPAPKSKATSHKQRRFIPAPLGGRLAHHLAARVRRIDNRSQSVAARITEEGDAVYDERWRCGEPERIAQA